MSCGCGSRNNSGVIPAAGSANGNSSITLGSQPASGMGVTKSGFCLKCFSFWFWVAAAVLVFWVLTEKK